MARIITWAAAVVFAVASPALALASETLTATFTQPDGGVTVNKYDNLVEVTVSGVGQSLGADFNDAFYLYSGGSPTYDPQYYQLTFGTTALVPFAPGQDAVNDIVGGLPGYNSSHVYSFELNTGTTVPTFLHFGVSDGNFSDNTGAYTITVTAIPEPSTWAMLLLGFAGVGFVAYRQTKKGFMLAAA